MFLETFSLQTKIFAAAIVLALWSNTSFSQKKVVSGAIPATRYRIVDAGLIIARSLDERPGLDAAGNIAAWSTVDRSSSQADLRPFDRKETLLPGIPSDSNSFAFDLNDAGVVVGTVESAADMRFTHAFVWSDNGFRTLPTLGGDYDLARAVNDSGLIVGASQTLAKYFHATAWMRDVPKDLGTLPGGDSSYANGVNRSGEIVGQSNDKPNRQGKAVQWTRDGAIHSLPTENGSVFSSALALNNRGQAVGFDNAEAVLWTHGKEIELGTFGDEPNAALDINDQGEVVGSSAEAEGRMRAFLWRKGKFLNLNKMVPAKSGWVLLSAFRINRRGEILAHGFYEGKSHLCLLIPE